MERRTSLWTANLWAAETRVGSLSPALKAKLESLTTQYAISVEAGDVFLIDQQWYMTHSGLLSVARRNHCSGIETEVVTELSDSCSARWVVKATVFKRPHSKGFVGYGDADPSNVSPLVRGAELRVAETRAVNRALRKAYGIGLCSVEELGAGPTRYPNQDGSDSHDDNQTGRGGNGQPRLRDRLLVLIRQHQLDAEQVKRYAALFCGTTSLREANRDQVERLVNHLENLGRQGREKLLDALNDREKDTGDITAIQEDAHGQPRADRAEGNVAADHDNANTQSGPAPAIVPHSPRGRSRRRISKEAAA